MKEKITPVGLKGYEINERMKELMGVTTLNEDMKNSAIELTKKGPDGKIYGIIRENHEYYIKISTKQAANLVVEDFSYIGGLQNKKQEAYPTYSKAIKHLNLKFNSLNEAYQKSGQINVFETDGYGFGEMSKCCHSTMNEGICGECGGMGYGMNEYDKEAMANFVNQYGPEKGKEIYYATANKQDRSPETFEKNEGGVTFEEEMLSNEFQAVEDMNNPEAHCSTMNEGKLSIERAINEMDEIIDFISKPRKKKVYTLK